MFTTNAIRAELCSRYMAGESTVRLAAAFGKSVIWVRKVLIKGEVKIRNRSGCARVKEWEYFSFVQQIEEGADIQFLADVNAISIDDVEHILEQVYTRRAYYEEMYNDAQRVNENHEKYNQK